jgi:hypothetical protein
MKEGGRKRRREKTESMKYVHDVRINVDFL